MSSPLPPGDSSAPSEYLARLQTLRLDSDRSPETRAEIEKPSAAPEGRPWGKYLLLSELGKGGMGVVWRAWDRDLNRFVAVKMLRGIDSGAENGLVREARLVAQLRHPNIVPVYEIGTYEGQPFLAMELIEGTTLDRAELPLRDLLAAIRDIAFALDAAHRQGIVHRDVKPGNILIEAGESRRAFILDFGVAREIRTPVSQTGSIVGTPEFMAPEQIRGDSRRIGPASDVYSLGATLYRLLTGRLPYAGDDIIELVRRMSEEDPVPPRRLRPDLPGEVETILLRAMEKDPVRRYPSARAMAEDLDRFLRGDPILARPPSLTYRLKKKLSKHRRVVLPSSLALALLLALGCRQLVDLWERGRRVGEGLAQAERLEAELARQETEAKLMALRDTYLGILSDEEENSKARSGLQRTEGRLSRLLKRKRAEAEKARLREEAARRLEHGRLPLEAAYQSLSRKGVSYEEIRPLVDRAREFFEQAVRTAPEYAPAHHLLGRVRALQGWEDQAEACWREAIRLDPGFGPAHFHLGRLLLVRSYLEMLGVGPEEREARKGEARRLAEEAAKEVEAAERAGLENPLQKETARAMVLLLRNREAVRPMAREAERKYGRVEGLEELYWLSGVASSPTETESFDRAIELHPGHVLALFSRAAARSANNDLEGAIEDLTAALRIHPRFAHAYNHRGAMHFLRGEDDAALRDFQAAVSVGPGVWAAFYNRGLVRLKKKDFRAAIEDFTRALEGWPRSAAAHDRRGFARLQLGDAGAAIEDFSAAIRIRPRYALAYSDRGLARHAQGDLAGALEDFQRAMEIEPELAGLRSRRGKLLAQIGNFPAAIEDLRIAVAENPRDAGAFADLATSYARLGKLADAEDAATRALAIEPDGRIYFHRGVIRHAAGNHQGALEDLTDARRLGHFPPEAAATRGFALLALGRWAEAESDLREALRAAPAEWPFRNSVENALRRLPPQEY